MTEFRYDEQSQHIVVTLAGNQPLNADELLAEAKAWLDDQKTAGALDGYQLHPRRIKQLLANRRDSAHLGAFNKGPLTFIAATTARHHGDIQLSPVELDSPFSFKLSLTPIDLGRQPATDDDGFNRFAANIADLARSQGFTPGNRSQLHAAYVQWQAGSLVNERPIGKPYGAEHRLGKRYRLFSHQIRPEIYLVIWDSGLLTDHEGMTKMIAGVKHGVSKVNAVGARHYELMDNHLRKELERAIHGPERLGVDMPLSILVAIDKSYSDAPALLQKDPEIALPKSPAPEEPRHQPVVAKALSPKPAESAADATLQMFKEATKKNEQKAKPAKSEAKKPAPAMKKAKKAAPAKKKAPAAKTAEIVRVDGDVTRAYPNQQVRGSMYVAGSIEAGVTLAVTGDLVVDGAVGSANLEVGGNLIVKQAIVAGLEQSIEVKGHLSANAIANSKLFVCGNIVVATSIIHSTIEFCRNLIIKDLGHGLLAGGTTKVRDHLICGNIGFPKGDATKVHIGMTDLPVSRELVKLEERQAALTALKIEWQNALASASGKAKARAQHRLDRIQDMLSTLEIRLQTMLADVEMAHSTSGDDFGKAHLMVAATLWDNVALFVAGKGYKLPRAVQRVQVAADLTPPVKKLDFDKLKAAYLAVTSER